MGEWKCFLVAYISKSIDDSRARSQIIIETKLGGFAEGEIVTGTGE